MANKDYNKEDGVWRTIGGRRVFIRNGQNLADAMKESGKFKNNKRGEKMTRKEKEAEYEMYKKLKEDPNSDKSQVDWEELESKYKERYLDDTDPMVGKYGENGERIEKRVSEFRKEANEKWQENEEKLKSMIDKEKDNNVDKNEQELSQKEINSLQHQARKVRSQVENGEFANERERENLWKEFDDINDKLGKDRIDGKKEKTKNDDEDDLLERVWQHHLQEAKEKGITPEELSRQKTQEGLKREGMLVPIDPNKPKDEAKRILSTNKQDPYDDPESEESQRLQSIQSRYDDYLQKTEGRGASYGEIAYVDGLRGKDLDDFEKELDDFEMEEEKKSTNKKMNDGIRAKASKKSTFKDDLPKASEIKEQGNSNRKEVSENIQAHILDFYDSPQDFVEQMENMNEPTMWHAGQRLAEGGSYEIYYDDQRKFLDSLKINPKGKEFSDDRVFQTYASLIGRESERLYNRLKKNAYNKYKQEHPLTKMSFEEFKDMQK